MYNQLLVVFRTAAGRSPGSRHKDLRAFPVSQWHPRIQTAYSDEFAQASHLFPFSPRPPGPGTVCFILLL